jgi:hypothetical protein
MVKEQRGGGDKPQCHPKATFDILMAKYKEDRADVRGHKKLDHPESQTG